MRGTKPEGSALSQLRPKQLEGVRWMVSQFALNRALGLFDDPGLGKTLQTLCLIDLAGWRRICIVSPAGARRVWFAQILQWFPHWRDRIVIVEPGRLPALAALAGEDVIVLVAYDLLSIRKGQWAVNLTEQAWDLLVLDEAHYLKGHSQRTNAIYGRNGSDQGLQASAERVLLLTGTPTPNHIAELWQPMRALWPQTLHSIANPDRPMSEDEFIARTCVFHDGKYGRQVVGSTDAGRKLVRDRLSRYVRRVTKAEALPELPPVTEQDVPIDRSAQQVIERLPFEIRSMERYLYRASDDAVWRAMRRAPVNDEREGHPLATLRRALGEQKIPGTVEWVIERLACGAQKMLIFGWHVRALERLHMAFGEYEPVLITGSTPPGERAVLVERFQTRAACRVFIGQILAAGTAITLHAASEVTIFEPSWVPGENQQAIDRAHRLGQQDHVLAHYLYLPGTLDQRIIHIMRRKAKATSNLFTGRVSLDDARQSADIARPC